MTWLKGKFPWKLPMAVRWGLLAALLLFFLATQRSLQNFAVNSDNPYFGLDYFTLPRCGLALREGTSLWTSPQDYPNYGPWASLWGSHPAVCLVFGVPLSYLSPWVGYWLSNALYLVLHLFLIIRFGKNLALPYRKMDCVFFTIIGIFIPWYVLYHQAQYHGISVLALAMVLQGSRGRISGFILSALSKPFLAPGAITLLFHRKWKEIFWIGLFVGIGSFLAFGWTLDSNGISFGTNHNFERFFAFNQTAKYNAHRWAQISSLSLFFSEFMNPESNYKIRLFIGLFMLIGSVTVLRMSSIQVKLILASLFHTVVYAHGHEYHRTLLVPILLYLYCQSNGWYRRPWLVGTSAIMGAPSVYLLFRLWYGLPQDTGGPVLVETNYPLYLLFTAHRPLSELFLVAMIFYTERKNRTP